MALPFCQGILGGLSRWPGRRSHHHAAHALIEPDEPEQQVGRVILPPAAQQPTRSGVVVEAGKLESEEIQPGVRVQYRSPHNLTVLLEGSPKLILVPEADILAIWEAS